MSSAHFASIAGPNRWAAAETAGLDEIGGSALALARLPALAGPSGVDLPGPFDVALDGFAVSAEGQVILGVRAQKSLVLIDPGCSNRRLVPSAGSCEGDADFPAVSGLAAGQDEVYVADGQLPRVLMLRLPGLALASSWEVSFGSPRRVALDGARRVHVLDAGLGRLLRLAPDGRPDPTYDTGTIAVLAHGLDLFVSAVGAAFVSIAGAADILRFSPSGAQLAPLAPPSEAPGLRPGALSGDAHRLYVADRASGQVWAFDLVADRWLAPLPRFRAPVAGLAVDGKGNLYARTGAGMSYLRLEARTAHISRGFLNAGPYDAGAASAWMRVRVDADVPEGTRVRVETALADREAPIAPLVWRLAPCLDSLVHAPEPAHAPPAPAARFLWIRVSLETDDPGRSPRLRGILAETPGDDYLARLPAVYARKDAEGGGFLRRLLESFRAELGDIEGQIDGLARRLDPATAPADHLEWLASWVAFDLPPGADLAERRALLQDA